MFLLGLRKAISVLQRRLPACLCWVTLTCAGYRLWKKEYKLYMCLVSYFWAYLQQAQLFWAWCNHSGALTPKWVFYFKEQNKNSFKPCPVFDFSRKFSTFVSSPYISYFLPFELGNSWMDCLKPRLLRDSRKLLCFSDTAYLRLRTCVPSVCFHSRNLILSQKIS